MGFIHSFEKRSFSGSEVNHEVQVIPPYQVTLPDASKFKGLVQSECLVL